MPKILWVEMPRAYRLRYPLARSQRELQYQGLQRGLLAEMLTAEGGFQSHAWAQGCKSKW